jgi:TPR repeat protein
MLRQGDIAAARLALRRAAEAGSAEAARNLAMSFDPDFLRRIGMAEAADLAQSAEWSAKARELGSNDLSSASQRLATVPKAEER